VTAIKESLNHNALGISTLFGKLKEHEHEIIRLKSSEEDLMKKEKKPIVLKTSSSKANLSKHGDSDSKNESPSEEEMGLFVRHFNRHIQNNGLRHSNKNLGNSRKTQLQEDENVQIAMDVVNLVT